MNEPERYAEILQTALEIQQKELELKRLYFKLSKTLTVHELKRNFSEKSAGKAFKLLDGVEIKETTHVKSKLLYKDVELHLHEDVDDLGSKAMKNCLTAISSKRLLA